MRLLLVILVALAIPVSQLRAEAVVTECCCPDATKCHCPDHKPDKSGQPSMRACHKVQHQIVSPQLPSFVTPAAIVAAPARVEVAPMLPLAAPHAPPPPAKPAGPS